MAADPSIEWNATECSYRRDLCVHDFIAEHARTAPDAIAIRFGSQSLTYRELEARAKRLARQLRALGVGPDVLVGTFVDRSSEMIIVLLAILKAGGAYLPLDATYPRERLAAMLQDARPRAVIYAGSQPDVVMPAGTHLIPFVPDAKPTADDAAESFDSGARPDNLAYVEFTSGSTGRPKGVCIPHRAICRLVQNNRFLKAGPGDVFLQLAPVSFDASTLEIWGALTNGACVAVAPPGVLPLDEIATTIRAHAVSHLWLTSGLFDKMVEQHVDTIASVRHVMAGGDVLTPKSVARLVTRMPAGSIFSNGYGPTENTTFTTTFELNRSSEIPHSIPIGRPISNTTAYVVDDTFGAVPIGLAGQLVTGGEGLARCYLSSPALTAERFVPDPFGPSGGRVYCTGDLARWRPDGVLEFLGRNDHQVKIRGFRIELAEIEAALARREGVNEVAVIAREDPSGDKRLVAYLVGTTSPRPTAAEHRSFLGGTLPDYMMPSAFVWLEEMPLTPNGKLDRKALPVPDWRTEKRYVAPRTAVEEVIVDVWASVLGVSPIGVEDDFFELGGYSLALTQAVAMISDALNVDVDFDALFDHPTVGQLAAALLEAAPARDIEQNAQEFLRVAKMTDEEASALAKTLQHGDG
ncbi:MAG: non-ribosomal peptide synthetase [Myxococcales bacterium]|nr:non-ribosomal peptide synthetase [Myxococcales bacterium]